MARHRILIKPPTRRDYCAKCRTMIYHGGNAEFGRHAQECAGLFRYRCPVHGWMTKSKAALSEHFPCDKDLLEKLMRMKPVKRPETGDGGPMPWDAKS